MTLIDKIKMLFEATTEVKFLDVKAVDGTLLRTAKAFEKDETVEVIAEDGTTAPAPDATYELEDGSSITILGGIITEVVPAEAETTEETPAEDAPAEELAEAPAAEPVAETPAEEANEDNTVADLTNRVGQLEEALAMLIEKLSGNQAEMTSTKEALSKVKAENEALKQAPAAKPVSTKKFEKVDANPKSNNRIADLLANNTQK